MRPKKADIDVRLVALAFAPHWLDAERRADGGVAMSRIDDMRVKPGVEGRASATTTPADRLG